MKKVLYFISFVVLLLTSCTSKENKADALIKARGFECANVEKLEEFQCNPASAEMVMVAYNSLWRNDSLSRNMRLSSSNINYVYNEIQRQEQNAKKLLEKADEIGMINNHTELCGYYVVISPDKINGAYIDKNRKCTRYEVFFDKDVERIIGIHPIRK